MKPNELLITITPLSNLKCSGIYMIFCCTANKAYIGQSKNVYRRWVEHKARLRKLEHNNPHLQNVYNKYGPSSLQFFLLEEVSSLNSTHREAHWLSQIDEDLRLNLASIKDVIPTSEETKSRISKALIGNKYNLGKKLSDDHRAKISKSLMGNKRCLGREAWSKGLKLTEEHKQKLSEAKLGKKRGPISETTRQKMREAAIKRYSKN